MEYQNSFTGSLFFIISAIYVALSIIPPSITILGRSFRGRAVNGRGGPRGNGARSNQSHNRLAFATILFTWAAPLISFAVAFSTQLVPFYPLFALAMAIIVASNVSIFILYPTPMKPWQWLIIGSVLALISIKAILLLLGPGSFLAPLLLPHYGQYQTFQ